MGFTFTFIKLFFYGLSLAAPLLVFFLLVIYGLGQIVGRKESWTPFDSFYWSLITATTVGYGDIRPLHKVSKLLSILIAFMGLLFTGIIVALSLNAAILSFKEHNDISLVKENIEQLKKPSAEK